MLKSDSLTPLQSAVSDEFIKTEERESHFQKIETVANWTKQNSVRVNGGNQLVTSNFCLPFSFFQEEWNCNHKTRTKSKGKTCFVFKKDQTKYLPEILAIPKPTAGKNGNKSANNFAWKKSPKIFQDIYFWGFSGSVSKFCLFSCFEWIFSQNCCRLFPRSLSVAQPTGARHAISCPLPSLLNNGFPEEGNVWISSLKKSTAEGHKDPCSPGGTSDLFWGEHKLLHLKIYIRGEHGSMCA